MNPILKIDKMTKRFGGLVAVNAVDIEIYQGEIIGLIGANGAGKTTLFNCIAGYYHPEEGKIEFEEENITKTPSNLICHLGIARTFQLERIFKKLTGLENVLVGAFCRFNSRKEALKKAYEIMELCDLTYLSNIYASSLTVCDRKRLEFARALATNPKVLLIDEIVAGLNPSEVHDFVALVKKIRQKLNITIIWVEHVMEAVMNISDRVIVLDHGEKIAEGTAKGIAINEKVVEAYLGVKYDA